MPLDKDMSHSDMVAELISTYKKTGKIGATVPRDMKHALEIANAVAYNIGESKEIQLVNKEVEEMNLEEILSSLEGYLSSKEKELGIADEALEDGATVKVTLDNGQSFDVPVEKDTKEEEIKKMYPIDKEVGVQGPTGQQKQARVKDVTLLKPVGESFDQDSYNMFIADPKLYDLEMLQDMKSSFMDKRGAWTDSDIAELNAITKRIKELKGVSEDFEGEEPQAEVIENPINVVSMDIPLLLRILEWAREDSTKDEDLHFLTENLIKAMVNTEFLAMEDYENIIPIVDDCSDCSSEQPELDLPMEVEEESIEVEESMSEEDMGDMGADPIAPVGTVQSQIGKTKKGKALKRTYKVDMPRH